MRSISGRLSGWIAALAAGLFGATGCVVGPVVADTMSGSTGGVSETGDVPDDPGVTDAPAVPDDPDEPDEPADPAVCSRVSDELAACEPAASPDVVFTLDGFPEPGPGAYIGAADCTIAALDAAPDLATIELACVHLVGDLIDPVVTLTIHDGPPLAGSALHVGRDVRLTAVVTRPDSHGPYLDYIRLTRPSDGALLLAATYGDDDLSPRQHFLDEIGLLSADWYAPLAIAHLADLCPEEPAECDGSGTRERGALSFTVAGRAPATIFDHRQGTIDGGYQAAVDDVLLYAYPYACVDNSPLTEFVVIADAGCPGPLTQAP